MEEGTEEHAGEVRVVGDGEQQREGGAGEGSGAAVGGIAEVPEPQ